MFSMYCCSPEVVDCSLTWPILLVDDQLVGCMVFCHSRCWSLLPGYLVWQVRRRVVCLPLNGLASTLE